MDTMEFGEILFSGKRTSQNGIVCKPSECTSREPACACCLTTFKLSSAAEILQDCKMNSIIEVLFDCLAIRLSDTANVCEQCRDRIRDIYVFKYNVIRCAAELQRIQEEIEAETKIKEECDAEDIFSEQVDSWPDERDSDDPTWFNDDQNIIKLSKDRRKTAKSSRKMEGKTRRNEKKAERHLVFSEDEDQNMIRLPKVRLNLKLDRRLKQNKHRAILKIENVDKLNSLLRKQKEGGKRAQRALLEIKDMDRLQDRLKEEPLDDNEDKRSLRSMLKAHNSTLLQIEDVAKLNELLLCDKERKRRRIKIEIDHNQDKNNMERNRPYSLNAETLVCEVCQLKSDSLTLLERHMTTHFPNFICENCGKGFGCKRRLKLHLISHVNDKFPCKVCGKILKNANAMNAHVKVHRDTPFIFMCPKCPERFKSYYQRQKHLIGVHGDQNLRYKCKHCESIFTLRSELRRHVRRSHLQEKNHICSECGAGFFSAHGLKAHMTKHTGERRHRCPICEKAYPRVYTLREHMRIHNNDKRFVCGVCARAFTQKCTLKGHMKVHEKFGTAPVEFNNCVTTPNNDGGVVEFNNYNVATIPNNMTLAAM